MEAIDLNSLAYWESAAIDIRLNPKRPVDSTGLRDFLESDCGLHSSVVIATSGSSGAAKFVVLAKSALLTSARAVNAHCGVTDRDVWLGGLSTFHVGGLGIFARAACNGATVFPMAWDAWTRGGEALIAAIGESRATLTSLTPVHVGDLVRAKAKVPSSLRGVFLGGGRIDPLLVEKARALGWPVWATYGMSESASQIATSTGGAIDWLPLLPIWEAATGAEGRLRIRGEALFSGYATKGGCGWSFDTARDDEGWFTTGDRVELRGRELRFLGRGDDLVKVSGELVSLSLLSERVAACGLTGLVVALPHDRREHELALVLEGLAVGETEKALAIFNEGLAAIEQVSRVVTLRQLPRTDAGKIDRAGVAASL
jgi:o-succinylbenzoate---CoA ligase